VRRVALVLAIFPLVGGGCATLPPGHWRPLAGQLCAGRVCYQVGRLGPEWRVTHIEGAAIGFFNPRLGGVIQANATCRDDASPATLEALTRHLLIGYTDRRVLAEERVPLAAREALHTVVAVRLDGVPMVLDLYVLKRNGCIFDLSYAAPPDQRCAGQGDFAHFVAGFVDETPT
jgi:hypothetical protein